MTSAPRKSTFSIAQNVGHASVELMRNIQDVLHIEDKLYAQYTLFDRIRNMKDDEIRRLIEARIPPSQFPQYFNAWAVLFSLMWKRISDPPRLRESDNCMYFFVPITTRNGTDHNLFMKSVNIDDIADGVANNPLIDNLNGHIINTLCRTIPSLSNHVMRYLTSFTIKVERDGNTPRWLITDLTNPQSPRSPFGSSMIPTTGTTKDIFVTSVFDSIEGRAVCDLLDDTRRANLVLKALPEFCDAIRILGMRFGMMHNDMHTGNVFLDQNTLKLVMIDYGMVTFAKTSFIDELTIQNQVDKEKQRNYLYFTNASYDKLVEKHQKALKYRDSDRVYFSHVFDFAIFMSNIAFDLQKNLSWTWCDGYFHVRPAFLDRPGSYIEIPNSYDEIQIEYLKAVKNIKQASNEDASVKKGMLLVAEGVFFMSWILLHIHTNVLRKPVYSGPVKIDMDELAHENVNIMFYYFQMYDLSKISPMKLYETFMNIDQNVLATSTILQNLTMKGGKKKQKAGMIDDIDIPLRNNANVGNEDALLLTMIENEKRHPPLARRLTASSPGLTSPAPIPVHTPAYAQAYAQSISAYGGAKKKQSKRKQ